MEDLDLDSEIGVDCPIALVHGLDDTLSSAQNTLSLATKIRSNDVDIVSLSIKIESALSGRITQ